MRLWDGWITIMQLWYYSFEFVLPPHLNTQKGYIILHKQGTQYCIKTDKPQMCQGQSVNSRETMYTVQGGTVFSVCNVITISFPRCRHQKKDDVIMPVIWGYVFPRRTLLRCYLVGIWPTCHNLTFSTPAPTEPYNSASLWVKSLP